MQIDIIEDLNRLKEIKSDWDAVYEADTHAHFFLSWVWLFGWFKLKTDPWLILAVKPDNSSSYVAFLPLGIRTNYKYGLALYNELYMGGNHLSDYTGFICLPEYEENIIPGFSTYIQQKLNWLIFHFKDVLDPRLNIFLNQFSGQNFEYRQVSMKRGDNFDIASCPYIPLPETWEQYIQNFLSSNTRQKIQRFLRKVENSEEFNIIYTQADNLEQQINILLELWQLQWGKKSEQEINSYRNLLCHCFENGCLYLPILWHNNIPLVANANFIDLKKKTILFYITGRTDKKINNPPPGTVIHAHSIRYAIENGFKIYDFLRGNEEYKFSFGAKERFIKYIIIKRNNLCI